MKSYFRNLLNFFIENEKRIVLGFGVLLIALVSFTFGMMKGQGISQDPMIVSIPENPPVVVNSDDSMSKEAKNIAGEIIATCVYVGSKKGSKYYSPTCSYAKKINAENLRCFSSDKDALDEGYVKSTSCD